jgi:hypothetical protein
MDAITDRERERASSRAHSKRQNERDYYDRIMTAEREEKETARVLEIIHSTVTRAKCIRSKVYLSSNIK